MICFSEDDFVRTLQLEKKTAIWIAELSDGRLVYQDDGRPGLDEPSAWKRLSLFLEKEVLKITNISLKFRSHKHTNILPSNQDGYFFSKSSAGLWGSRTTYHFYLLGHLCDGVIKVQKWKVPELLLIEQVDRDKNKVMGGSLIANNNLVIV